MSQITEEISKVSINHHNEREARWLRQCQLSEDEMHDKPLIK